jgi:hypothetical protein
LNLGTIWVLEYHAPQQQPTIQASITSYTGSCHQTRQ